MIDILIVFKLKIKKLKLSILENLYLLPQKYPHIFRMRHQTDRTKHWSRTIIDWTCKCPSEVKNVPMYVFVKLYLMLAQALVGTQSLAKALITATVRQVRP